jgi:D-sedoheptulose 7-phosphate isomerase
MLNRDANMKMPSHSEKFLEGVKAVASAIPPAALEEMAGKIAAIRERGGRLFFLGVGGSAAAASHAVNDFRKIAAIESYAPTDNVSELTARINDSGWESVFSEWLKVSRLTARDGVFVLSVGGGDEKRGVSVNLVEAVKFARSVGAAVLAIVGRAEGYAARDADACVVVPVPDEAAITPFAESFQSVLLHLLVTHPLLKRSEMKWEALQKGKR